MSEKQNNLETIANQENRGISIGQSQARVRSINDLENEVLELAQLSGETNIARAFELKANIISTYNQFYPPIDKYVSKLNVALDMPTIWKEENRKHEYRPDVDEKVKGMLRKPNLAMSEIAPMFISQEINPTSAFHILLFIGDEDTLYRQRIEEHQSTQDLYPKRNMRMVLGLVRTFEPGVYNMYRDVVQGLRKPRTYGAPKN